MKYSVLGYLIGEGFRNIFKNKKSTGASIAIMCATMLIFGLFFLIGENVNHMVKEVESEQGMSVFLEVDTTEEQIQQIEDKIKALPNVAKVAFISKEEGLNSMKQRLGEDIVKGFEQDNPLSDSFAVNVTDLSKATEVKTQIDKIEKVKNVELRADVIEKLMSIANGIQIISIDKIEKVKNVELRADVIEKLMSIANGIQIISGIILVLLIIISVFIIANTIKLTVHARRKEISIMKYVGATNGFIRWPFIVEGMIIGIISVMISILIVGISYTYITNNILTTSLSDLNISYTLLTFADMFPLVLTVYIIIGIGIGVLGSVISMRKYLEV